MITKDKVLEILNGQIVGDGYYVVDVKVSSGNKIMVSVDGPQGITIEYIKKVSRLIEGSFDREVEDFELEVSSPGIGQPFKVYQQYLKCILKPVKVTLKNSSVVEGVLVSANQDSFVVKVEVKEKREGDSKKKLYVEEKQFTMDEVKSVIETIIF